MSYYLLKYYVISFGSTSDYMDSYEKRRERKSRVMKKIDGLGRIGKKKGSLRTERLGAEVASLS
jgi:hypothetical protein